MIRLSDYKRLQPGDFVYPGFAVRKSTAPEWKDMFIIGSKGHPYMPHIVLCIVEDGPCTTFPDPNTTIVEPDGQVFCVGLDGSVGYFSGQAVLFVDEKR